MKIARMLLTLLCATAMTVGGCGHTRSKEVAPVTVGTQDRSPFPAGLAGHWKSDRHGWEFVIEPDGRISSAVISLGRVQVYPGRTTTVTTVTGEQAVFTSGLWAIDYDPASRMLVVKIAMSRVRVPMGPQTLEGSSTDVFSGEVSPMMDTWQTQWTAFTDYRARTGASKSVELSTDKTYGDAQPLVFTRMPDRQPSHKPEP